MFLEFVQMHIKGYKDYLRDPWNWADVLNYTVFLSYFVIRIRHSENATILYLLKDFSKEKDDTKLEEI